MQAITLHGADGTAYRCTPMSTNALCELEASTGKSFGQIMVEIGAIGLEQMRVTTVRMFLKACMAEPASEEEIGALIDHLGFDGISTAINGLIVPAEEKTT